MSQWYCTLADAKDDLKAGVNTVEDAKLFQLIRQVSQRVDRMYQARRPLFLPYLESRLIRADGHHINSTDGTFQLDGHLLALTSVLLGTTNQIIGTNVEVWPSIPSPYQYLRLLSNSGSWYDQCLNGSLTPLFVTINGIWGYHGDYANAWLLTTTLTADPTSGTTLTVTDIDGTDGYGRSPWISPGALLKVEDEFMLVTAVDTGTNVATVKRGMNGTTGVAHAIGTGVYVWQVEDPVRRVVARQSGFLYARRGAYESSAITDVGVINYPSDLLAELRGVIQGYVYL